MQKKQALTIAFALLACIPAYNKDKDTGFINTLKNFGLLTEAFYFTDQGLQIDFLFDLN